MLYHFKCKKLVGTLRNSFNYLKRNNYFEKHINFLYYLHNKLTNNNVLVLYITIHFFLNNTLNETKRNLMLPDDMKITLKWVKSTLTMSHCTST